MDLSRSIAEQDELVERLQAELTRYKLREKELVAERDFFSNIFDAVGAMVVLLDRWGNLLLFNQACQRLFGYSANEIREKLQTGELPLPDEVRSIKQIIQDIRSGESLRETEWTSREGDIKKITWSITTLKSKSGEVDYIFATGIDITSRKMAEELLERERNLLDDLINSIPDLIFFKDISGAYTGCNRAFEAQSGRSLAEIVGRSDAELYAAEQAMQFERTDRQVMESGKPVSYLSWTKDHSGKPLLIETRKSPYYGPDGNMLGVIGIGRDITRHRIIEDALRNAKSEIEQLIASLSSGLIGLTVDLKVSYWNPSVQQIFGKSAQEIIGKPLKALGVSWAWDTIAEALIKCRAQATAIYLDPMRFARIDGSPGYLGINVSPILDGHGLIAGFIILVNDITERKILESRLVQLQKLESIGQLAAGISHEINSPIQYVGDNITFLQSCFEDLLNLISKYRALFDEVRVLGVSAYLVDAVKTTMEEIDLGFLMGEIPLAIQQSLEGVQRVSGIVRAMKDFSHPGVKEKTVLDINKALESTLAVTSNEWKYIAEIQTELDPDLPHIMGLPSEINQVFLNIIINAVHAIEEVIGDYKNGEKGIINIRTRSEGEWVEVLIRDTGGGIPKEIETRIFEPFFTTKEVGKGTGQGLAIAYDVVVRKHGGMLTFKSDVGKGTTFIVRLPIQASQPPERKNTDRFEVKSKATALETK